MAFIQRAFPNSEVLFKTTIDNTVPEKDEIKDEEGIINKIPLVENKLITIVMPTYNQGEYIKESIESILKQTYKKWELIIINDGSTDNTENIINKFKDKRIRYFRKENGGTGSALNLGFKNAKGEYETWFASDNIAYENYLEILVNGLNNYPDYGFVYGDSDTRDDRSFFTRPLIPVGSAHYYKDFNPQGLLITCYIGIAYMWRKEVRQVAGDFALTPSEDFDMHLKMSEICKFKHICRPPALTIWRNHNKNLTHRVTAPGGWKDHYRFVEEAKERRKAPFFSIMMLTYNRQNFFREALESVNKQTYNNFEVLIWSNSDDPKEDYEIMRSFNNDRFLWIENTEKKNILPYIARNKLIPLCRGKYITLLDDDDLLLPEALNIRYNGIMNNCCPDYFYADTELWLDEHKKEMRPALKNLSFDYAIKNLTKYWGIIGANVTIRNDIFKRYKYDEINFPLYVGDVDLLLGFLKDNLRGVCENKTTYIYRYKYEIKKNSIYYNPKETLKILDKIKKKHCNIWDGKVKNGYFEKYDSFDERVDGREFIERYKLKGTEKGLEIGSGAGKETKYLYEIFGQNLYTIDISQEAQKILKKNIPDIKCYQYIENKMPFDDNYFDFIYSAYCFQHNSVDTMIEMLRETKRILNPSGFMLIEFLGKAGNVELIDKNHVKDVPSIAMRFEDLVDMVTKLGFKWYQVFVVNKSCYKEGFLNFWIELRKE